MTQVITENLRTTVSPAAPKNQRVCRHFARGRCTWGSSCRFSHEVERSPMDDAPFNSSFTASQQQQLQKDRRTILKAALDGDFEIRPYDIVDGLQRYLVKFPTPYSPIIIPRILSEEALRQHLMDLEGNEQIRIGGLLFLVGEPVLFWSMMQIYRLRRTTTSPKWDSLLENAKRNYVECMFFRWSVGCLSNDCPFVHNTATETTTTLPMHNMTTNNALLTPLLGLCVGSSTTSPTTSANTNSAVNLTTAKKCVSSLCLRPPVDTTRRISMVQSNDKSDDAVMFRDPVWGTCSVPELKSSPRIQPQRQEIVPCWETSSRATTEGLW
ncbi:putative Zinc finger C x8 C x5 C x3 H type (and similar) [Trypanosoma vivax]|uniref:C3H1-type domain-containing protein n=1 Tax=Trypanosoma vivax (strain Y486) TaxID=1055687 RepID=G0U2T2_TRYVY|nr:hypothetical protein TRVL_09095 [Trypanosoma vivax]KAH8604349.1 putative Zinc finger C x8 C x5 C x3 H type (and similar) [Trypanosoma vivax]CCC50586.1 conserved hypothetical protein [Trypanosoma vivax Y486]